MVRLELGILAGVENSRPVWRNGTDFGLEFRPMVVISPPLLPLYGRLVFASVDPFSDQRRQWAYGAAVGLGLTVAGFGVFAEVGALPRTVAGDIAWVLEARAGALLHF